MAYRYHKPLKPLARRLRAEMTDAEQRLWRGLRGKQIAGVQVYRQRPIGAYIVDFYAPRAGLVIEVDGSQHFEASGSGYDLHRSRRLQSMGLKVLRFDNLQVLTEIDSVLEVVRREMLRRIPPGPLRGPDPL